MSNETKKKQIKMPRAEKTFSHCKAISHAGLLTARARGSFSRGKTFPLRPRGESAGTGRGVCDKNASEGGRKGGPGPWPPRQRSQLFAAHHKARWAGGRRRLPPTRSEKNDAPLFRRAGFSRRRLSRSGKVWPIYIICMVYIRMTRFVYLSGGFFAYNMKIFNQNRFESFAKRYD